MLLASAGAWGVYVAIARRAFVGGAPLPLVVGGFAYGVLFLVPLAAVEALTADWSRPPLPTLGLLLYLGAGCSALALLLSGYALARIEAGRAATVLNLEPIVGLAVAALALGEPLGLGHAVGGSLLLAGAWLAARSSEPPTDRLAPSPVRSSSSARRPTDLKPAERLASTE